MKKIIDKILMGVFVLLCFYAFLLVASNLPKLLNELFNTTMFNNTHTICFFLLCALLLYVYNYYEHRKSNSEHISSLKAIKQLEGLNSFYTINYKLLPVITKVELENVFTAKFTLINSIVVSIDLTLLTHLDTTDSLVNFNEFLANSLLGLDSSKDVFLNNCIIEKNIKEYFNSKK